MVTLGLLLGAAQSQQTNSPYKDPSVVEPGKFTVMVGPNSVDLKSVAVEVKP